MAHQGRRVFVDGDCGQGLLRGERLDDGEGVDVAEAVSSENGRAVRRECDAGEAFGKVSDGRKVKTSATKSCNTASPKLFSVKVTTVSACASARWRAVLRNSIHVKSRHILEKLRIAFGAGVRTYTSNTVWKSASLPLVHARMSNFFGSAQMARAAPFDEKAAAEGGPAARERASPRHSEPAARMARREPCVARRTVDDGVGIAKVRGARAGGLYIFERVMGQRRRRRFTWRYESFV